MRTFEQCRQILEDLGGEYNQKSEYRGDRGKGRKKYDLPIFSSITLPLSASDWCRLCIDEEYWPAPCHRIQEDPELVLTTQNYGDRDETIRLVQDKIREWLYHGGFIEKIDELVEVARVICEFFGDEDIGPYFKYDYNYQELIDNWETLSSLLKIALCYHLVKDYYTPEVPRDHSRDPLKASLYTVSKVSFILAMERLQAFSSVGTPTLFEANKLLDIRRFIPALRTVMDEIEKAAPDPMEAWAIVHKEKQEIAENSLGYVILASREEAERMMRAWKRDEEEHQDNCGRAQWPVAPLYEIRPVRVSLEKGIEFLDRKPNGPKLKKVGELPWYREPSEDSHHLWEQYEEMYFPKGEKTPGYWKARQAFMQAFTFRAHPAKKKD